MEYTLGGRKMSFLKAKTVDATTGTLWKKIIIYVIPVIIGAVVQNCFNAVDLIVLGNMADSTAVASIGATSSIISLLVNSFIGISGGSRLILAKLFGAKDSGGIQKTVDTSLITALSLGIMIVAIGIPLAPQFLIWTNCPENCLEGAVVYMRIYVMAAPAILLYNFGSSILSASGDSQRPLYYIIISGLANIILNIILCLILTQKVAAVAIATAASQLIGAGLVLRRLSCMEGDGRITITKMRFDKRSFRFIMSQGLPMALTNALYPFANLQIQAAINSYGVSAIAGNSAAASLEAIFNAFAGSFSTTAAVFIGQNMGAKQNQRARQSMNQCLAIGCAIGVVLGVSIYATGNFWLSLYLPDDPMGIVYGRIRMLFVLMFNSVSCAKGVYASALQNCGYIPFTTLSSIVGIFGFRMFWMWCIYPLFPNFHMLMACFLVSWTLVLIAYMVGYYKLCSRKLR